MREFPPPKERSVRNVQMYALLWSLLLFPFQFDALIKLYSVKTISVIYINKLDFLLNS